jgi:hypothetical protein
MADINVERKGPSIWPWIIGLLVLALLIWAVAEIVDRDDQQVATTETYEEPGAIPAPVTDQTYGQPSEEAGLTPVLPLRDEHVGTRVGIAGTVVGQPVAGQGFYLRDADNNVIFVRSPETVQAGEAVTVTGTLQRDEAQRAPELQERDGMNVTDREWSLRADQVRRGDQAGHTTTPGAPGTQPGTTAPPQPNRN